MDWTEDISAELPAPRDDEPASLRRDIADELSDHLQCALHRELHRTGDEAAARRNVVERFGDPARVGRRLWWDAMQERIMSQRIMLAVVCVMAAATVAVAALAWSIAEQSRRANAALVEQGREMNQVLLDRLEALAAREPAAAPVSLEWNPLQVRLTPDDPEQRPEGTFDVSVSGHLLHATEKTQLNETAEAPGIADFGLVRTGSYSLTVRAPWGETLSRQIIVRPGQTHVEEIVCPSASPEVVETAITLDWPDDLRDEGFWAYAEFRAVEGREIAARSWSLLPSQARHSIGLLAWDRMIVDIRERPLLVTGIDLEIPVAETERISLTQHLYHLQRLRIIMPSRRKGDPVPVQAGRLSVLADLSFEEGFLRLQMRSQVPPVRRLDVQGAFKPEHGRNNWTIRLPDETWDAIRNTWRQLQEQQQAAQPVDDSNDM